MRLLTPDDEKFISVLAKYRMDEERAAEAIGYSVEGLDYHLRQIHEKSGLNPRDFFDLYKLACMIPEIRPQTGDVISRRGLLEQFGIHIRTANAGSVAQCVWKAAIDEVKAFPGTDASVENDAIVRNLEKEQENLICDFQDYVNDCIQNPAPFCAMRNKLCVDKYGACKRGSSACSGFMPRVRRDGDE